MLTSLGASSLLFLFVTILGYLEHSGTVPLCLHSSFRHLTYHYTIIDINYTSK